MQQEKHEKLLRLIDDSSILSPREKAEWAQLLELMNDKQVNELEKILTVAAQQDDSAEPAATPQALPPLQPRPAPVTPESLLHNLQPAKPNFAVPPAKPIKPLEDIKRGQPFTRIKDVLAEKELPPGHPNPMQELELAAPRPAAVSRPEPLPAPARPAPPLPKAAPPAATSLSDLLAKKLASHDALSAKLQPKGPALPKIPQRAPVGQILPREIRSAGVNLDKVRGFDQAEKVFQPAQKAAPPREHFYEKPSITSLESLAKLTYDNFSAAKADELFGPISRLIQQHGFHETRAVLEQSPLYRAYVDTGVKVLGGQADFVQEWEGLMSQPDFEKFADLLIQMHTA